MSFVRLDIHPETPQQRKIDRAVEVLHKGGVAAYPTDSVYGLGCVIESRKAADRIYRAKGMSKKQRLAIMVPDLSAASEYGRFSRGAYRLAKRILPGPFVLIVPATNRVPRNLLDKKQREVGIRIPGHPITRMLLERVGRPIITTTAQLDDQVEACRDADEVVESFRHNIDVLIDGGTTGFLPTTVLKVDEHDENHVHVVREGAGSLEGLWL